MPPASSADLERRQFRQLVRLSFGRLIDAALASREVAAEYFVIWSAALLLTPPLFYTVQRTSAYPWIRRRSLDALQQVALTDRLFFVVWSMLAAMLIASVLWDALLPDKTDQRILGVLPVRNRTVAAARLAAALAVACTFVVAIGLPTAVLYGIGGAAHPSIGSTPAVFTGHLIATVLAGVFVFCALLLVRGLLVVSVGAAAARRAAMLMQLATVFLLVESFMFLPGIVPGLVRELRQSGGGLLWPPAWFIAAYTEIAGPVIPGAAAAARLAYASTIAVALLAAAAYLIPARVNARRAIESRDVERSGRVLSSLVAVVARLVLWRRASRALFRFTILSVLRNGRPLLVVATYLGLGVALAGIRLTSATVQGRPLPLDAPYDYLLAVPLVLSFAVAAGLRSAFTAPAELPANWTFRLSAGGGTAASANATRAALMVLGVLPVSLATLAAGAGLWGVSDAMAVAVMHAAAGLVLCEVLTLGWRAVPFARARSIDPTSIRVGAPLALIGLHLFAFRLDDLQQMALGRASGVVVYVVIAVLATLALRIYDGWRLRSRELAFEIEEDAAIRQLGLSGTA
jgi:hypothetical protein